MRPSPKDILDVYLDDTKDIDGILVCVIKHDGTYQHSVSNLSNPALAYIAARLLKLAMEDGPQMH